MASSDSCMNFSNFYKTGNCRKSSNLAGRGVINDGGNKDVFTILEMKHYDFDRKSSNLADRGVINDGGNKDVFTILEMKQYDFDRF